MNKHKSRVRRGLKTKALIRISDRVRLVVSRSSAHISSQIVTIDPMGDKVLAVCSTMDKELRASLVGKSKVEQASLVGKLLGERALINGITHVAFDRSGHKYHGRIKALADGAREAGLNF
jgi:large subunit ribosomal protein L18